MSYLYSFAPRVRSRVVKRFLLPSLTKQSERDACDINRIVAKYVKTGVFDHVSVAASVFADVSEIGDYQSIVDKVMRAQDAFNSLSSNVRNRFANDPARLLAFLSDERNRSEAVALGLVKPDVKPDVKSDVNSDVKS